MSSRTRLLKSRLSGSSRTLSSQIASLFANGEQGLWYDIEGFRDAWSVVGSELLTNGDFSAGTAGWTATGGSTQSVSGGLLTLSGGAASGGVYQDVTTTATWVVVTAQIRRVSGTGNGAVWGVPRTGSFAAPNTQLQVSVAASAASTTMSFLLQREQAATGIRVYVQAVTGDGVFEVDSISVREWLGSGATALYQDAGGSLPAYMPGQGQVDSPVGLLLDKRKGLGRSAELNAGATLSGWTPQTGWSIDGDGVATAAAVAGGNALLRNLSLAPNTFYEITVTCTSLTAGSFFVRCGFDTVSGNISSAGTYTFRLLRGSNAFVYVVANSGLTGVFSKISVRELPGNHAYQATTASRPTLSARYNMLTSTENLSDASWALGANWAASVGDSAPDGTPTAIKITSLSGTAAAARVVTATAHQLKFVIYTKSGTYVPTVLVRNNTSATGLVTCTQVAGVVNSAYGQGVVSDVGGGWRKIVVTITSGVAVGDLIGFYYGATGSVSSGLYWWVWHPDLRTVNDGVGVPDYQRVVDANNYDTSGFPLYLKFDGVDDWLQTPTVDFSAYSAVFLCASIRKLSDSSVAVIVELSATYANAGTFALFAPALSAQGDVSVGLNANIGSSPPFLRATGLGAPVSVVVSGILDTAQPLRETEMAIRINGTLPTTVWGNTATHSGTGNLGVYPLYIGRRAGTTFPFGGRLYGLLIRGGSINDSSINKVERYLNQKAKVF